MNYENGRGRFVNKPAVVPVALEDSLVADARADLTSERMIDSRLAALFGHGSGLTPGPDAAGVTPASRW